MRNGSGVWRWVAGILVTVLIITGGAWMSVDARIDACELSEALLKKDLGHIKDQLDELKADMKILIKMKREDN